MTTTSERRDTDHRAERRRPIRALLDHSEWVHVTLGLIGNLAFLVGSVLFLWDSTKVVGVWLFIVGAAGMLINSVGRAVVDTETDS